MEGTLVLLQSRARMEPLLPECHVSNLNLDNVCVLINTSLDEEHTIASQPETESP